MDTKGIDKSVAVFDLNVILQGYYAANQNHTKSPIFLCGDHVASSWLPGPVCGPGTAEYDRLLRQGDVALKAQRAAILYRGSADRIA